MKTKKESEWKFKCGLGNYYFGKTVNVYENKKDADKILLRAETVGGKIVLTDDDCQPAMKVLTREQYSALIDAYDDAYDDSRLVMKAFRMLGIDFED
jgi:hypothetical protein